ncbi:MAG: glycosyltransferase [Clostridia bacterium]|nr:glycosyltransferase [Clostridia bacterium]
MKKILHIISDSNIGGAGKYLLNYLEYCNTEEYQVKIILPFNSKLIPEIANMGFDYCEIEGLAEKSFSMVAVKQLIAIFKKEKPHIIHSHACLSARVAGKLCGVKGIVYTRHTDSPPGKKLSNPVGKIINGFVNGFLADGIIAISESARKNLTDTGISDKKINIIYNGVSPAKKLDAEERKVVFENMGFKYGDKIIGIVARLEEIKGHEYFIDAAKIVQDKGYDAKFVIAGIGSREEFLKQYAKEKGVNNVTFLGFVKNVSDLNNIMYLQVNTSSYEALGLAAIECMRLGVPSIVSSYGGNPEVVTNGVNGFVVNGQNSQEFAEKIIKLIDDEELYNKFSQNAVNIYNEKFKAELMAKKMEEFYSNILEGKR